MKMLVPEGVDKVYNTAGELLKITDGTVDVDDGEAADYERVGYKRIEQEKPKKADK